MNIFSRYIPIHRQIFFFSAILLTISLGILSSIAMYHAGKGQKQQLLENQTHDISAVKTQIDYALRGNTVLYPAIFQSSATTNIIDLASSTFKLGIDIYDTTGTHLFKSSSDYSALYYDTPQGVMRTGSPLPVAVTDSLKIRNTYTSKEYVEDSTIVISMYSFLFSPQGEKTGIMRIVYPQDMYLDNGNIVALRYKLSYTLIILLLVAGGISILIARGIMHPLKKLNTALSKISAYSTSGELKSSSYPEELRPLIDTYNNMLVRVRTTSSDMAESEKERAWAQMAKIVAHEIKNPLTPMRLSVQSFAMTFDPASPDAHKKTDELCSILIEQIDTLSHIASSFASFSTSEHPSDTSSCNICEIVPLAAGIYRTKDISISVPSCELHIPLDKTSVVQIVSNMIKNALEAGKNGISPHIDITVKKEDTFAVLSIKDNGKGMSEALRNKIFNPSFTTKTSGMGMGLSIISRIVHCAAGDITCYSKEGIGTEFIIKIPLLS